MNRYLVFAEAAEYLRCGRRTLTELLRQTDIPRYRLGGKYLFAPEALDRWLAQNPNVRLTKARRHIQALEAGRQ